MYFGGQFVLFGQLGAWCAWFGYSTFLRYAFIALMHNQFDGEPNGQVAAFGGHTVLQFYGESTTPLAKSNQVAEVLSLYRYGRQHLFC